MADEASHWQSFWQELWLRESAPPFHLPQVNPHLIRHFPQLRLAPGARVLVPLCGKSVDLGWLAAQGVEPVGVELSPQAAAAYFAEQNLTPQITRLDLDPFERFWDARGYDEWQENRSWAIQPALGVVQRFIESFQEYPARMRSFDADTSGIMEMMMSPTSR